MAVDVTQCRYQEPATTTSRRRRKRYVTLTTVYDEKFNATADAVPETRFASRDAVPPLPPRFAAQLSGSDAQAAADSGYVVAIKFTLSVSVNTMTGEWPDEYHTSQKRLDVIVEELNARAQRGQLSAHAADGASFVVIEDSLVYLPQQAGCATNTAFHRPTLMCGT